MEAPSLAALAAELRDNIEVKTRTYHLRSYDNCFLGSDVVSYLVQNAHAETVDDAVALGEGLLEMGVFHHVTKDHGFKNAELFYRFAEDEAFHGGPSEKPEGGRWSWGEALLRSGAAAEGGFQPSIPVHDVTAMASAEDHPPVTPLDAFNVTLLNNCKPRNWRDPTPDAKSTLLPRDGAILGPRYNLVVIGAGAGGLVSAAGAAGVGGKVAIIEEHLMGGDCLTVGCVPSKALIRCARAAHEARRAAEFGVGVGEVAVDFGKIMERMRRIRAQISPVDSAERFSKELGVDVFQGRAKFTGKGSVEVNGQTLRFAAAVVATGTSPSVPPIPGLADVPFLTNATFFNLTELPKRFGIIGPGVIGIELAQCMARFGSEVTVFGRSGRILEREDREAADLVQEQLVQDGVAFELDSSYSHIDRTSKDTIELYLEQRETPFEFDVLLVAAGRRPNVENLGLEAAGVEYTKQGIKVNDLLQTSNKSVYAVGDCCSKYKFTHVADFMARLAIRNALFFGSGKFSNLLIPWATYTEPEIAHVGLYEHDLVERKMKFKKYVKHLSDVDRAICDGEEKGFVKILVAEGSDKILGATIVAATAGNMISEISVAMQGNVGLGQLANVIHPYPTQAEAIRQCGDLYNKTRLTIFVKSVFRGLLGWRRK